MTHDEHLVPARTGRDLDATLADLTQSKPYANRYSRYGSAPADTNIKQYLFIVLKRKWLILSILLVVTSLATIQAYRDPSVYEGVTMVRIEGRSPGVLSTGTGSVLVASQPDPNFWGTQLRLLRNPSLARQVVLTLDLPHDPKFISGQAQSSVFNALKRIFSGDKPTAGASKASPIEPISEAEMNARQFTPEEMAALEPYEDAIAGGLQVDAIEKTSLVNIRFQHTDPVMAQKIANTLADVFVKNNMDAITAGSSTAEMQLSQQIAKIQEKIRGEERGRFEFAKAHNLPIDASRPGADLEGMRLATYSAQLLEAENNTRTQTAIYNAAVNAPDPFSAPEVQSDQRIQKLRDKVGELEEKLTALKETYTDEWPEVQKVKKQLKAFKDQVDAAPKEVLAGLKSRRDSAIQKQKSLMKAYGSQHGTTIQQTKDQIDMANLTQALTTHQPYFATLMQRFRELKVTSGSGTNSEVHIATYSRPGVLTGPARMRTIALALILSLVAGIGLAFLLDFFDDTMKSVDDVDRYLHLPALALIPSVMADKQKLHGAIEPRTNTAMTALAMVKDVRSPVAEAYRHLRTSLLLSSAGTQPKTILVTSSQPSEGKTTTAINTAFMLAQTGADVLIIDCDLRRPRLHANFNLANTRGLTNYLSGESPIDDLVQAVEKTPSLKLLTSGPIPPNPAELLGSEEMRKLLASLSEKFTHIVVDSPPAISFTDASIISTFVDGVILVVHGGRSSRAVVRRARQQLLDVGAHIFGVVLNNVKAESKGYYGAGYYSSYYQSDYYTEPDDDDAGARATAR